MTRCSVKFVAVAVLLLSSVSSAQTPQIPGKGLLPVPGKEFPAAQAPSKALPQAQNPFVAGDGFVRIGNRTELELFVVVNGQGWYRLPPRSYGQPILQNNVARIRVYSSHNNVVGYYEYFNFDNYYSDLHLVRQGNSAKLYYYLPSLNRLTYLGPIDLHLGNRNL